MTKVEVFRLVYQKYDTRPEIAKIDAVLKYTFLGSKRKPGDVYYVVDIDGSPKAFVVYNKNVIRFLYVDPLWRGKGFGIHLLKIAEANIFSKYSLAILYAANKKLVRMYEKMGWTERDPKYLKMTITKQASLISKKKKRARNE